jgi:hypothetical protein
MNRKRPYRSSKLQEKKRRQRKIKIILWCIFFAAVLTGASYWSFDDSVTVEKVTVLENEFIDEG